MDMLKDILTAIGGITVIGTGIMLFCKGIVEKYIHTVIEKSAEKELEKVKNKLAKNISAFEVLLRKEFEYYESVDKIYAEIIVDIQDVYWYVAEATELERKVRCEELREKFQHILKRMMGLKNHNLAYQVYVPKKVFEATGNVVCTIQDHGDFVSDCVKKMFYDQEQEIEKDKLENIKDEILAAVAWANVCIMGRVKELSDD